MRKGISILVLSPWGDDWDIKRVVGYPEIAVLIKGFAERGIKIHLLIPKEKGFISSNMDNLVIHSIHRLWLPQIKLFLPMVQIIQYLILNISFMRYGLLLSKIYSFDLIYGLSGFSAFAIYYLGRRLRKPTILKLLGLFTLYPIKRWNPIHWIIYFPEIIAYKLPVNKLLVLDDGTQGDKVASYFNVPQNRFLFYSQSIDRDIYDLKSCLLEKAVELKKLGFAPNDYIVLFASRLTPLKGPDIALKALQLILKNEPRAKLLIVGDGPARKKEEKLAKKLGVWDSVNFIGSVRYVEMRKYYQVADVFLSTNTYSNLTLSTVEAMVSGVPVVTLDIRDTNKLVKNGTTGMLVGVESSCPYMEIANAVCFLLKDAHIRKRIALQAKEFVLGYLPDWNERIEAEINLIKSLV